MSKATSGSGTARPPTVQPQNRPKPATKQQADAARFQDFFGGLVSEMRRVVWPTRPEWVSATVLTIVLVAAVSLFTYACDVLFTYLFGLIHH